MKTMADEPVWTIESLKEHFEQRFTDSQRKVEDALAASEKAIAKAEAKQDSYNATHNDLIRKAERLAELTMPREEIESRISSVREHCDDQAKMTADRVEELRRGESHNAGGEEIRNQMRQLMRWIIGLGVTVVGMVLGGVIGLLGLIAGLVYFLMGRH